MYEFEILIGLNLITLIALYVNAAVIGRALEIITETHDVIAHLIAHAVLVQAVDDGDFELLDSMKEDLFDKVADKTKSTLFEDMESEPK